MQLSDSEQFACLIGVFARRGMHAGGAGLANHLGVTARLLWLRHYHKAERLRDFGHTTLFCSTNKHASRKVASFVFKEVQIATNS